MIDFRLINKVRPGLRGRAVLFVAILVTVCVLGTSIYNVVRVNQILQQNQQTAVQGIGSGLQTAIELPLAVGDVREMARLTDKFMELLPDAQFILVQDTGGAHLALSTSDREMYEQYIGGRLNNEGAHIDRFTVLATAVAESDLGFMDISGHDRALAADGSESQHDHSEQEALGTITICVANTGLREA